MIKLADAGTPDILASINGDFVAIEVKNGQAEVGKWKRIVEKFKDTGQHAKSHTREINQYLQQKEIRKAGGTTLVVGSLEDLESDLKYLGYL